MKNTVKNRAVFLDRDGVINYNDKCYYVYNTADFMLTPHLEDALKLLYDRGFLLIVITNQGGIAKGEYSTSDVENLHLHLQTKLAQYGVRIHEMYCCPHHDAFGKCLCRKPLPLMVQKAAARFNIDLSASYFIGDRASDMQTAAAAGVCGILVDSNKGILDTVKKLI